MEHYSFPKILHLAPFLSSFAVSLIGKVPCIRLGSLRDSLSCFWNVKWLLSGQNENKVFTVCWYTLQFLEQNTKCMKITLLGKLRMSQQGSRTFHQIVWKLSTGPLSYGNSCNYRNNLKADFSCLKLATPQEDVGKPAVQLLVWGICNVNLKADVQLFAERSWNSDWLLLNALNATVLNKRGHIVIT